MNTSKPSTIDAYIADFPLPTQRIMNEIRKTILKVAPDAEEAINYAIPAFRLNNTYLVYFAAFKNHIGFYPAPVGMEAFKKEFSIYKTGKGSVQFPLDEPMPLDLITRIVKFRMKENQKSVKTKKGK